MEELLTNFNVHQEVIDSFKENCITVEQLEELESNSDLLKELIPKIGYRIQFVNKLREYRAICNKPILLLDSVPYDEDCASTSTNYVDTPVEFYVKEAVVGLSEEAILTTPAALFKQDLAKNLKITDLLQKSTKGQQILSFFGLNKKLNDHCRDQLVECVIEDELKEDVNKRINIERFEQLSLAIEGIFPTEIAATYFTNITNTKSHKTGTGKLFHKYYNYRRQLKATGLINVAKNDSLQKENIGPLDDEELNSEFDLWLQNSTEPWPQVLEHWGHTFLFRKALIRNQNIGKISTYFDKYPCLKEPLGYTLLEKDFNYLYPTAPTLFRHWNTFCAKVIKFSQNNASRSIIEKLSLITGTEYTSRETSLRILKLFPYLLKAVPIKKNKQGFWKPTKLEVEEGFLICLEDISDLKTTLEVRKKKLLSYGLTLQPTPIIVNNDNGENCYVFVDNHLYEVNSPLKAVDVCFKIIHSLHALYPVEAEQVWLLIQRGIYNIQTEWDNKFTGVNTLLNQLSNIDIVAL